VSAVEWDILRFSGAPDGGARTKALPEEPISSSSTIHVNTLSMLADFTAGLQEFAVATAPLAISNTISQLIKFELPKRPAISYGLSYESPVLGHLDNAVTLAHRATDSLLANLPNGAPLSARLHELIDLAKEEYPDTEIPSYTSIATLRRFIVEGAGVAPPDLSLLSSGSIWLSWASNSVNSGLAIFRDGTVSFGLLVTGQGRPTHVNFAGTLQSVLPRIIREQAARGMFP
jgi:hypothetical protein